MSVEVRLLQRWALGGATYDVGNVVAVSADQARDLVKAGVAERVESDTSK